MVFGEITTKAKVDYEAIVRKTCKDIGFISDDVGLDGDKCKVLVYLEEQSPDIGQGVHGMGTKTLEEIGAGDQVGAAPLVAPCLSHACWIGLQWGCCRQGSHLPHGWAHRPASSAAMQHPLVHPLNFPCSTPALPAGPHVWLCHR